VESTTAPTFTISIDRVIRRDYHGIGFAQFGAFDRGAFVRSAIFNVSAAVIATSGTYC
jgi:hypothetical protein